MTDTRDRVDRNIERVKAHFRERTHDHCALRGEVLEVCEELERVRAGYLLLMREHVEAHRVISELGDTVNELLNDVAEAPREVPQVTANTEQAVVELEALIDFIHRNLEKTATFTWTTMVRVIRRRIATLQGA